MSRKAKLPIAVPKGVEANVSDNLVTVKGPNGTLTQEIKPSIILVFENDQIMVKLADGNDDDRKFLGLYHTLIENMIAGVTKGFEKKLQMIGVGYRAVVQGDLLDVQVGLSHPCKIAIPEGIKVKIDKNTLITISGVDKRIVGQLAADIRAKRPPEPYQGKGIRYVDERVRRKAGKAAASR